MGTPHCPGLAGVGTAALRPAQLLSHTPHPHPATHSPAAPDTGKSMCYLPWEVPAPGQGLPNYLHPLLPWYSPSQLLVLAVIPC